MRAAAVALAMLALPIPLGIAACSHGGSHHATADASSDGDDGGDAGCPSGQLALDDGGCQAPGVPPGQCGQGFMSDGNGGCVAILPAQTCPKGQMAVPGDTSCHDVASCGSGTWGSVPVDATTQYVDASYQGGGSDGSQGKPWTKIADAIGAAASGGLVAIAAGSYAEDLTVQGKAVRLWGRCPSMVEIVGSGGVAIAAVFVQNAADGTEIHDVAIRGAGAGLLLSGSKNVLVQEAWVHDTAQRGIDAQDSFGATVLTVRGSLLEATTGEALYAYGATATLEASVIRDTQPYSDGTSGRGVEVDDDSATKVRGSGTVRGSLLDGNSEFGIYVAGSDATIDSTLVRGTQPQASDGSSGFGIEALVDPMSKAAANATIQGVVLDGNHTVGLLVASSKATVTATCVRNTRPRKSDGQGGLGISIEDDPRVTRPANVTIQSSLVESSEQIGVAVVGSQATIGGAIVRDTRARASDGTFGDGLTVVLDPRSPSLPPTASLSASLVQRSARAGVSSFGGQVSVGATAFDCNGIDIDGELQGGTAYGFDLSAGGDSCGCDGGTGECQVLSSGLSPPSAVGP